MSDDLISRQAAIEAMRELPHEYNTKEQRARTGGIAACQTIIRELPSVHPKTGQWVYGEFDIPHCSECGMEVMPCNTSKYKYCPKCGARMEETKNDYWFEIGKKVFLTREEAEKALEELRNE